MDAEDLIYRYLRDELSREESIELERLLEESPELRTRLVREARNDTGLREIARDRIATAAQEAETATEVKFGRHVIRRVAAIAAVLVGLLLVISLFKGEPNRLNVVATIIDTKSASWGGGSLPTEKGASLTAGQIELISGLATLEFASGAELVIEAPVSLELIDSMNCILNYGSVVANVPPSAKGFTVDTSAAQVVDYGTEFGIFVDQHTGTTDVQVFDGIVDVEHRSTRKKQRMTAGQRSIVDEQNFQVADASSFESAPGSRDVPGEERKYLISTSEGRGTDASIDFRKGKTVTGSKLLVKRSLNGDEDRVTYLKFDLSRLGEKQVRWARIRFQVERGGGYASFVPDSTFAVYGVLDDRFDDWEIDTLTPETAPQLEDAVLIGKFKVLQGKLGGGVKVPGPGKELSEFLNQDKNRLATMIVMRETAETKTGGLVHAFASSRHPEGVAPTLQLSTGKKPE